MNDDIDNVTSLPVRRAKEKPSGPLEVVSGFQGCQHAHVEVCEREAEVTCRDCKAKLNPIWVLTRIANDDRILVDRWANLQARVELMKKKTRVKCRHCNQFTPIPIEASSSAVWMRAHELKRGIDK